MPVSLPLYFRFFGQVEKHVFYFQSFLLFFLLPFLIKHLHLVHEVKHLHQMSGTAVTLFTVHPITNRQRVKKH